MGPDDWAVCHDHGHPLGYLPSAYCNPWLGPFVLWLISSVRGIWDSDAPLR
jgi:hypothetical protein